MGAVVGISGGVGKKLLQGVITNAYNSVFSPEEQKLDSDIAWALSTAAGITAERLKAGWNQSQAFTQLKMQNKEEANATNDFFDQLKNQILISINDMPQSVLSDSYVQDYLANIDEMQNTGQAFIENVFNILLVGHTETFKNFIMNNTGSFSNTWTEEFGTVITQTGEKNTKAYRRCQVIWNQSVLAVTTSVLQQQGELLDLTTEQGIQTAASLQKILAQQKDIKDELKKKANVEGQGGVVHIENQTIVYGDKLSGNARKIVTKNYVENANLSGGTNPLFGISGDTLPKLTDADIQRLASGQNQGVIDVEVDEDDGTLEG